MKFNFVIDQKQTIWWRAHYKVEAETLEEATKLMGAEFHDPKLYGEGDGFPVTFVEGETLDTIEDMGPGENSGYATRELAMSEGIGGISAIILNNAIDPFDKIPKENAKGHDE